MGETYNDRHDSKIYGARLIIYRRGDVENASFTFRAKVAGQKGYIRRNTKADDPARAMVLAEQAYEELQVRKKSGLSLIQLSANAFFDEWINKQKTKLTASRWNWKRNCWDRYISSYLGHHNLADLTKKFVDGYWDHRTKFWTTAEGQKRILLNDKRVGAKTKSSHNVAVKPSYATLRMEAGLINEVLQGAVDSGHLSRTIKVSAQDAVGKNDRGDGYRDTFTDDEWNTLTTNLYNYAKCRGKYAGKRLHSLHRIQREMLRAFVLMAASTGMRVGELKQVRWRDLDKGVGANNEDVLIVRIRPETSKVRRGRSAVSHSGHILGVLEEWKAVSQRTEKDDLVFYSAGRNGEIGTVDLSTSFKNFLKTLPVEGGSDGMLLSSAQKPRTLYSLRHFYAISRLRQGVDVFRLAENMGTGVTQIRNHYGRHISGDAYVKELTKYESKSVSKVKNEALAKLVDMVQMGIIDEDMALEAFKNVAAGRFGPIAASKPAQETAGERAER